MSDAMPDLAMATRGQRQLVMLPRDPERGYVYWEWSGDQTSGEAGKMTVSVRGADGWRPIETFSVTDERGGRFIDFDRPGAMHRCALSWGGEVEKSPPLLAPRREPGDGSPAFVGVQLTEDGLQLVPTDYDHPVHGVFPAADFDLPSSSSR